MVAVLRAAFMTSSRFLPHRSEESIAIGLVLLFGAGSLLAHSAAGRRLARQGGAAPAA